MVEAAMAVTAAARNASVASSAIRFMRPLKHAPRDCATAASAGELRRPVDARVAVVLLALVGHMHLDLLHARHALAVEVAPHEPLADAVLALHVVHDLAAVAEVVAALLDRLLGGVRPRERLDRTPPVVLVAALADPWQAHRLDHVALHLHGRLEALARLAAVGAVERLRLGDSGRE